MTKFYRDGKQVFGCQSSGGGREEAAMAMKSVAGGILVIALCCILTAGEMKVHKSEYTQAQMSIYVKQIV